MAHASRILRRNYDSIEILEFDDLDGDFSSPWIIASCGSVSYDLLSMGRGELSVLYLIWKLSQVAPNSIVIVDEPESGLAAYSQSKLKEALAYLSAEKGIQFVVTTHATDMYSGLKGKPVTVLEALPSLIGHGPVSATSAAQALEVPRLTPKLCVFTEDVVAAELLKAIVRVKAPSLRESIEVFWARNGESALNQMKREFIEGDSGRRSVRLVVVPDGDQRPVINGSRVHDDVEVFLPGDHAPEKVLSSYTEETLPNLADTDLQPIVGDTFQFRAAVSRAAGSDHHDWFVEVSKCFESYSETCDALLEICLIQQDFHHDVDALVGRLESLLKN